MHVAHNITIYRVYSKGKRIVSYGGKSVYRPDMRRVYVLVHGCVCVCASHADEMKNGGRLKYMCQQNANPDNKERVTCVPA